MIGYIRDAKNSIMELPQLIITFSEVAGYKIKSKKSVGLLSINDKWTKKEIREITPFTIAHKSYSIS